MTHTSPVTTGGKATTFLAAKPGALRVRGAQPREVI